MNTTTINRYGAKFFIGTLVKVRYRDCNGMTYEGHGIVNKITGDIRDGFAYGVYPTTIPKVAWFTESELSFVNKDEKEEYDSRYLRAYDEKMRLIEKMNYKCEHCKGRQFKDALDAAAMNSMGEALRRAESNLGQNGMN